jgi:hypothetical protein
VFGDTKNITITMANGIGKIVANARTVADGSTFTAGATLTSVPKTVNLNITSGHGTDSDSDVTTPMFTYTGDAAGLGISAFMNADAIGPAHNAFLQLDITNLGKVVTSNLSGTQLDITSTPTPTGSFTLIAGAHFAFGPFNLGFSAADGLIQNTGDLSIDFNLAKLTIGFTNMSSLTLKLGISTAVEGTYGTFTFDEDSDTHLTVHDSLTFHCDSCALGLFDIDFNLFPDISIENQDLGNVIGAWHLARNEDGEWFSQGLGIPCSLDLDTVHIAVTMTPVPDHNVSGSGFTVSSAGSPNGWIVTPNPWGILPDFAMDVIAYFTTPESSSIGAGFSCE